MPDKRSHRGPHPEDALLFSAACVPALRAAVADLSLLQTRSYADKGALKLVGDRYNLTSRQRLAVLRSACSQASRHRRAEHAIGGEACGGERIAVDGYNLLITIESALSGGFLFVGRDGCCRDLASIHGTYRRVEETLPAIELIGAFLIRAGVREVHWYFDAPVSNSGRLKVLLADAAAQRGWDWRIELVNNPDPLLADAEEIVVTSDSWILDRADRWANLARRIVRECLPDAPVVDLCVGLDAQPVP